MQKVLASHEGKESSPVRKPASPTKKKRSPAKGQIGVKLIDSPQNQVDVEALQNDIESRRSEKMNRKANITIDKNGRKCHLTNQRWWTAEERKAFAQAVKYHGKNYDRI